VAVLALALVALAGTARADEQTDYEKGRNAFLGKQYLEAEARYRAMLDPKTGTLQSPALVTQARFDLGATLVMLDRKPEAFEEFRLVLLANPQFDPDPLAFSTVVLDAFTEARGKYREEIRAAAEKRALEEKLRREREEADKRRLKAYQAALEKQAAEEKITERRSRWIALVPFGVGQFQNRQDELGVIFLTGESALIVGTVITWGIQLSNARTASDLAQQGSTNEAAGYQNRANAAAVTNYVFAGSLLVTAIVGIVQAQVAFVPETVTVRKRPLPVMPQNGNGASVSFSLAPLPGTAESPLGGGMLGLSGRF
jgi:hypothetical protein